MKTRIIGMLCAAVLAGCSHKEESEEKPKPLVAVKTATAEMADIPLFVSAPSSIFPRELANIPARVNAPIRTISVKKGDSVGANQILAILENRDLTAARQEAQAAVQDAEADLQKVESGTLPTDNRKGARRCRERTGNTKPGVEGLRSPERTLQGGRHSRP